MTTDTANRALLSILIASGILTCAINTGDEAQRLLGWDFGIVALGTLSLLGWWVGPFAYRVIWVKGGGA